MKKISVEKLYELYIDTIQKCGIGVLDLDEDLIEYNIFEEFDIGVISFLSKDSLVKLNEYGFINDIISEKSSELRSLVMKLQGTDKWNIEAVKTSEEWRKILLLSDEIKELI